MRWLRARVRALLVWFLAEPPATLKQQLAVAELRLVAADLQHKRELGLMETIARGSLDNTRRAIENAVTWERTATEAQSRVAELELDRVAERQFDARVVGLAKRDGVVN